MPRLGAVIDTNVLVFDTFEDSEHCEEASSLLDSLEEWFIPSMVVHEYVWALRGLGLSFEKAREKVCEYILDPRATLVPVEFSDILFSLEYAKSFDEYNDLVILSIASRRTGRIATFDQKLRKRAERMGIEVLP